MCTCCTSSPCSDWSAVIKKLAVLLVLLGATAAAAYAFPSLDAVVRAITWMQHAGPLGSVAFVGLYGLATVLLVPASWTHGTTGFMYGPLWGPIAASVLATGFAAVNFILGRTLLRNWVERRLLSRPAFAAVDMLIADRGLFVVLLLRVSPISPFNPMSYVLGASPVRFRDFLLGTWLGGMLPVVLFSSLGATVTDLPALFAGEAQGPGWLQWLGLGVTLIASIIATRFAKQALDTAMAASALPPPR